MEREVDDPRALERQRYEARCERRAAALDRRVSAEERALAAVWLPRIREQLAQAESRRR